MEHACCCLLPSCAACCRAAAAAREEAHAARASTPCTHDAPFHAGHTPQSGSGKHLSVGVWEMIATVDERLRQMLNDQEGRSQYICYGRDYYNNACSGQSRHDHLVAMVCCVGSKTVQAA
eukprot:10228954-Karenia_brevis.AAC.1